MRALFCSLLFVASLSHAQTKSETPNVQLSLNVHKFTLDNGLTVLLHESHSAPLISYHTWYRVGSRDEHPGVTGAAHMLEHMMFKGAKKYSGKDFDHILHANGIVNNAFTTADYTGYYENLPSSKLELIMDVEVDRMANLKIDANDLKNELQVVGEERRWRIENNPTSLLRENLFEMIYKVHPYRWPVIGWMKDIQEYTSEKLRKFFETYYGPNNAVLVIAGDIDTAKTEALVRKYYGSLKPRELPAKREYPQETTAPGPQRKTIPWEVQSPTVMIGFRGLPSGHPESWALDLVGSALGSGKSSRLYEKLVLQKQVAASVGSYNSTMADPGIFMVYALLKPGQNPAVAEAAIKEEIRRLQTTLLSDKELQKLRNEILTDFVTDLKTVDSKAKLLALNEILFKDYTRLFSDVQKYNDVTVKDIQAAAKKYLIPDTMVTATLVPRK